MLGVLLEHGCDLFERLGEGGESGNILHFYASVCDDSTNALCLLSEAGGLLLQERDGLGRTPLDVAVEHKRIKLVELYRYAYTYAHIYTCTYAHIYTCTYEHIYTFTHTHICTPIHICTYTGSTEIAAMH
jgi:hypothetical protein